MPLTSSRFDLQPYIAIQVSTLAEEVGLMLKAFLISGT